jgi:hypothetical protein
VTPANNWKIIGKAYEYYTPKSFAMEIHGINLQTNSLFMRCVVDNSQDNEPINFSSSGVLTAQG